MKESTRTVIHLMFMGLAFVGLHCLFYHNHKDLSDLEKVKLISPISKNKCTIMSFRERCIKERPQFTQSCMDLYPLN